VHRRTRRTVRSERPGPALLRGAEASGVDIAERIEELGEAMAKLDRVIEAVIEAADLQLQLDQRFVNTL
jgi:hypothetical protein